MKLIALHLPQFHQIKENDEWWGEGFTEWKNVKNGKKIGIGHVQPRIPMNNNYYNLLDKNTMEWQAKISNENGIYGFCYYHYWFNGQKILEKPVENLLAWKDIKQNFCFCWANHTWKRTWNGTHHILIEQTYGGKDEWEEHFQYLLPFFKDERYIKKENKPIFVLYAAEDIEKCKERIDYFNKRARDYGFDGIYFIETLKRNNAIKMIENTNGVYLREPSIAFYNMSVVDKLINRAKRKIRIPVTYIYDKLWKAILKNYRERMGKEVIPGAFVDWDNTARHKKRGSYVKGVTPKKFEFFLDKLIKISKNKSEFLIINAWNEWAEGMYLEPDNKNKMDFLEGIKRIAKENKLI